VEILSESDGRVAVLAKGARRPRSAHRGLLQPFHRLNVRYSGKGNLKHLISAEWDGSDNFPINGKRLLSGFYINELIMKLLQKNEVCPRLFIEYEKTLIALANTLIPAEAILRRFEISLLMHMGVLPDFRSAAELMDDKKIYFVTFRDGIKVLDQSKKYIKSKEVSNYFYQQNEKVVSDQFVSLSTVKAIASYDHNISDFFSILSVPETALETKKLLRLLIGYQLGGVNLRSRKIMIDLTKFSKVNAEEYLDD
jgi:DNA repair protein RecO (recombination protein O)